MSRTRSIRYIDYVVAIGAGELVSREEMASRMGCSYSTALYNLDVAIRVGALKRVWCFLDEGMPGWAYGLPQTVDDLYKNEGGNGNLPF